MVGQKTDLNSVPTVCHQVTYFSLNFHKELVHGHPAMAEWDSNQGPLDSKDCTPILGQPIFSKLVKTVCGTWHGWITATGLSFQPFNIVRD